MASSAIIAPLSFTSASASMAVPVIMFRSQPRGRVNHWISA